MAHDLFTPFGNGFAMETRKRKRPKPKVKKFSTRREIKAAIRQIETLRAAINRSSWVKP